MSPYYICPTITAFDPHEYRNQLEAIKPFASRVHIDLMDGQFAPTKSPDLNTVWWFDEMAADIHLMYQKPMGFIDELIKLKPSLVTVHFEAEVEYMRFADQMHESDIRAGLAILSDTPIEDTYQELVYFDHVLIFSGHLGYHGGVADLALLDKVKQVRARYPQIEISWDGGINDLNAKQLIDAGVNVLNVGGYIQSSNDPSAAYAKIKSSIEVR